jgi:hypothetical protein
MAQPTQAPGRRKQLPALKDLSRAVAHVDVAVLLGTGILTGIVAVVARRAKKRAPRLLIAVLGAMVAALALALRLGRRSGVTDAEVRRALPGDDLIADPGLVTDRAITIHAPAQDVWPWVVQMGYHRGGWYTSRWLDKLLWRIDNPSVDRIVPDLQELTVGDIVPDGPPGTAFFKVGVLESGHAIVYLDDAGTHVPGVVWSWAFVLDPIDGHATRTQVRTRATYKPSLVITLLARLIIGPSDFVMAGQVLRGIKRRAERTAKTSPRPVA